MYTCIVRESFTIIHNTFNYLSIYIQFSCLHIYLILLDSRQERVTIAEDFSHVGNFPKVIGCVDGTHINIKAPRVDEHVFVNRKNNHSVNVMVRLNMLFLTKNISDSFFVRLHFTKDYTTLL